MTLPAGTCLGPYEVLGPLGSGGMGEVYRARDSRLRRDVAVKLLPAAEAGDAVGRARLLREARTASALNHPNICTIFDVGEVDGRVFFAMELLSGTPLDRLAQPSGLPVEDVVRLGIEIASALGRYQHASEVRAALEAVAGGAAAGERAEPGARPAPPRRVRSLGPRSQDLRLKT